MKKLIESICLFFTVTLSYSQSLNLTGGVSVNRGTPDTDVLNQIIQEKQEEVFTRLFSNIVVKYFKNESRTPLTGVYNFPTYYGLYNIMTDLTVGKTKTTVSKAVINSAAELVYVYAFVKYYQEYQINKLSAAAQSPAIGNKIDNPDFQLVSNITKDKVSENTINLLRLNFYMEAAFEVIAKESSVQDVFTFRRPVTSTEVSKWYNQLGLINRSQYNNLPFNDITNTSTTLPQLITDMKAQLSGFLKYTGSDKTVLAISTLKKPALGFQSLTKDELNAIKMSLWEYGTKTDASFDQNIIKKVLNLLAENTILGADENQKIDQVYLDVEGLILSLDKDVVAKSKKSSVSSGVFFINPRPFFTIGTSTSFFLNDNNRLGRDDSGPVAISNVNFAAEKIGFRVKVWDGGYTNSFGPGEVYKWHGRNYVWTQPQEKPLISSVYYNVYASGILYNVVNLKTDKNFDYAILCSNIGVIFFNGLEFSSGIGAVYNNGFDSRNLFLKVDFDIPIIDYLSALKKKRKSN